MNQNRPLGITVCPDDSRPWFRAAMENDLEKITQLHLNHVNPNTGAFFRFNNVPACSESLAYGNPMDLILCELTAALRFYPQETEDTFNLLKEVSNKGGTLKKFNKYIMFDFFEVAKRGECDFIKSYGEDLLHIFKHSQANFQRKFFKNTLQMTFDSLIPEIVLKQNLQTNISGASRSDRKIRL